MMRFLFYTFSIVAISFLWSCSDNLSSDHPLFYQISEEDSTKYMNEILDDILEEAKENRRKEVEIFSSVDFIPPPCFSPRNYFSIEINSKNEVSINLCDDSLSISEIVFKYYIFNRNLTSAETVVASSNGHSPHYDYPFFNTYSLKEIERKIDETTSEWMIVKETEGADSALIEYFASKVEEWEKRKWLMEFLGIDELPELGSYVRTDIEYRKTSPKLEEVLNEVAFAFYQLRNYYSLIYFHETYLSLYERSKRTSRKVDQEKVEALEMLQPISFYPIDWNEPSPYRLGVPELQTEVK